uniref:Cell wall protein-like n=1 Tax=Oryza sativa subsp. japonica TaxID=39947 RepID=Q6YZT5_ORYSJ|nr:cell wall protein-like [Oryza sativa Japonica Group]
MAAFHGRRAPSPPPFPAPPVAGSLPPPLPPRPRAVRPCRRLPRLCNAVPFTGLTVSSPETRRNGAPASNQWHWCHCTPSGRLLSIVGVAANVAVSSVDVASSSSPPAAPRFRPEAATHRRRRAGLSFLLIDISSGSPFRRARAPSNVAISSFGITAARSSSASPPLRPNAAGVRRRLHRSSSPARRLAAPPPSWASLRRVPRRPRIRAAAAGYPRCLLAGPGRRRPPVVPGRRGVCPSIKPFSSVVRVRQVCRSSPVVVFVLASASSSLVPAASRLRPRIAAEVVPSPSVSAAPVRRCRSPASSRGGKDPSPSLPRPRPFGVARAYCAVVGPGTRVSVSAVVRLLTCGVRMSTAQPSCLFQACSFAYVLRVASVVPEVPEAWFAVVAESSEGRSL